VGSVAVFLTLPRTMPNYYPIHDFSKQGRYFGYASANIHDTTRLSFISGAPDLLGDLTASPQTSIARAF
ncbi:MAG: hypothetical protein WB663_00725, partial [Beijerinckiaceae bacterium]